jgi:hypothetical protein
VCPCPDAASLLPAAAGGRKAEGGAQPPAACAACCLLPSQISIKLLTLAANHDRVHVGAGPPPPPSKHPPPMATKLVVGHQLMGDGSTSYEEICTKVDGSKLGHRNGNDVRDHVYGSCWIYDHEQIGRDYWLATYNKKNLTWEPFSAGMKPPTNSYKIAGLLVGRNHGNETNACTHPESPYCVKGNVMPGRVTTNPNGTLAGMDYDDYGTCHVKTYMLACCGSCAHTYWKCSHDDHTCISVSNASKTDNITVFATQQECAAKCIAPPPPPLSKNPCVRLPLPCPARLHRAHPRPDTLPVRCLLSMLWSLSQIRFGHVIPVGHHVDVQIVQEEDPTITFVSANSLPSPLRRAPTHVSRVCVCVYNIIIDNPRPCQRRANVATDVDEHEILTIQ